MGTIVNYPHLVCDSTKGLIIEGTRYKVSFLAAEHREYGWTAEELHENHPDLPIGVIHSTLAYYYDHRENVDAEIDTLARRAETLRKKSRQPSKIERLKKRSK